MELNTDQKSSLRVLIAALMTYAGLSQDSLTAGHAISTRHEGPQDRAADSTTALQSYRCRMERYPSNAGNDER